MRKTLIILLTFTFIFSNPGLLYAIEDLVGDSITIKPITSDILVDTTSTLPETPSSFEIPEIFESVDLIPSVIDDLLQPVIPEIQNNQEVMEQIIPPTQITEIFNNQNDEAVDNEPRRDPGDENGIYIQEQSAYNNYKKEAGLTGNLRVDNFSGAAGYNLNLNIPAGRNGVQPSLNLYYNSHDKSADSWVGLGWSMDLGYLVRSTKKGTNHLYNSDEFTLFLNGQSRELILINEDENIYGARVESDYLKIQFDEDNNQWLITDTLGTKYYFGQSADSRQDDEDRVYKWLLDKVIDTNNNFYRVEYSKHEGQIYPSNIFYTGHGEENGPMEIIFHLEERADITTSYQTQFLVTTARRLNEVEIKVEGETKIKYDFVYTTGQNGQQSLLESVVKKGYQNNEEFVLPAPIFSYQEKSTEWIDDTENWQDIGAFNSEDRSSEPYPLVDINSDSWVDKGTAFHNGENWVGSGWSFPHNNNNEYFQNVAIGDINGDKYPDIINNYWTRSNDQYNYVGRLYINNTIDGYYVGGNVPNFIHGTQRFSFTTMRLIDINGDGLDDIVYAFYSTGGGIGPGPSAKAIYLNTGNGWEGSNYEFPVYLANCDRNNLSNCSGTGVNFVDINGDGLVDITKNHDVYLNTGINFEQEPNENWILPTLEQYFNGSYDWGGARFTDINTDGLIDIVVASSFYGYIGNNRIGEIEHFSTYINTGSGWERNDDWNLPMVIGHNTNGGNRSSDMGTRLLDINNDGIMDVAKSYFSDYRYPPAREVYLGSGNQANLLSEISNGYGGVTSIEYQASGRYFDDEGNFKNPNLPFNLATVKEITTTDGLGNEIITSYEYQDGAFYSDNDYTLNQYAGFGVVTSQTGNQIVKTYYHQGSGVDGYEQGEYEDSIYKKGRVYREEIIQDNGDEKILLNVKINKWNQEELDNGRQFVYLDNSIAYDYEDGGLVLEEADMAPRRDSVPDNSNLSELLEAQVFVPESEPQLVSQSEDGWIKTYYLGRNEGEHLFRSEFTSGTSQEVDGPRRDDPEQGEENFDNVNSRGDGSVSYSGHPWFADWEEAYNAEEGNQIENQSRVVSLRVGRLNISRIFLPFDTSELPEDITITNARLGIFTDGELNIGAAIIVNSDQHTDSLRVADYSTVGDVEGGRIGLGNVGYRTANLNEEGVSWIDTDGWTKLALRSDRDFGNNPPRDDSNRYSNISMSESYEEQRPSLAVEYYYNNINPGIPTELQTEEQTNPDDIANQTPHFTAVYNDENEDDQAIAYQIQVMDNGGQIIWDSQRQDLETPISNNERSEEIEYGGGNLPLTGMQYFWKIRFFDNGNELHSEGLWSDGQDYFYMDGSDSPIASTQLLTENKVNPIEIINLTPSFSAIYNDPNPIDSAKFYQIQVDNDADFSSLVWDSEKTELNQLIDNGSRSEEIIYVGEELNYNGQSYFWRIKFWDDEGDEGTEGVWSQSAEFSVFDQENTLEGVKIKAVKYNYDIETGNVTAEENLGTVRAANNGIFLDEEGDEKDSTYQYAEPVEQSSNILSAPKSKIVTNPNTEESTTVEMYYDDLEFGQVNKANTTKEDLTQAEAIYEKAYNDYGLVTSTEDPLGKRTTISYDENNYYPSRVRNNLRQTTRTEYDLTTGQVKRTVDPNGLTEERDYDAFGRLIEIRKTNPYSQVGTMLVMQNFEYNDSENPSWVKQVSYPNQSFEQEVISYADGLGRTIQTREEAETDNQYRVSSTEYNEKGNVFRQSMPYFSNNVDYEEEDWNTPYTQYSYDGLNRVIQESVITPENEYTTYYEYDGWNVLITDANGNQKKLYKDAYGQLIQVDEYLGDEIYSTHYEYNLLGKLTKITDSQNNQRNFNYDSLGRLLNQEEMHIANADDFGVWSYEYDEGSNLISKTDPVGNTVNYSYDELNRLLTEDSEDRMDVEVTYIYDEGDYSKGRLHQVIAGDTTTSYVYDIWGRVKQERKNIDGHYYTTKWQYNFANQPEIITYPGNFKVYYGYNNNGLVTRVRIKDPGPSTILDSRAIINEVIYSPLKQMAEVRYTNRTVSINTYDPNQAYRLTNKQTINAFDTVLQNLTYSYDNVGNIVHLVEQADNLLAKTTDYTYDDLYRLTSVRVSNSANNQDYERTYSYDSIGNFVNKSDIGDYQYQNTNPYQASVIGNTQYSYDANGNMFSDGEKEFYFDYKDKLKIVILDEESTLYNLYDQSGQRTMKQLLRQFEKPDVGMITTTDTTYYPNKLYEEKIFRQTGNDEDVIDKTWHVYLGNQKIAQITKSHYDEDVEKTLIFSDHLGSSSILTDSFSRIKTLYDYFPYGDSRLEHREGGMHVSAYKYTGQELDDEIGLYNYGARFYEAATGRFTSVDPAVLNDVLSLLGDPQSLNYYSYAGNNPVRYIDPNGETKIEAAWGWFKGLTKQACYFVTGTLTMSYYALVNPNETREILQQKATETINAWHNTIRDLLFNSSQLGSEMLQGYGIEYSEFEQLSDEEQGEVIGKLTTDAMALVLTKKIAEAKTIKKTWGNSKSLSGHFKDHGADFGVRSEIEYAQKANQFYKNSSASGILKKVDENGVTRLYDSNSNTFGSYNADGTTKTFFKPNPEIHQQGSNLDYWNNQ